MIMITNSLPMDKLIMMKGNMRNGKMTINKSNNPKVHNKCQVVHMIKNIKIGRKIKGNESNI